MWVRCLLEHFEFTHHQLEVDLVALQLLLVYDLNSAYKLSLDILGLPHLSEGTLAKDILKLIDLVDVLDALKTLIIIEAKVLGVLVDYGVVGHVCGPTVSSGVWPLQGAISRAARTHSY